MSKAFRSLRRVALGGAAIGVGVLLIGAAWKAYGGFGSDRPRSAPGRMVDIGGVRLHLICTGTGGPAVIFESGAGQDSAAWRKVQPQVARFTRACAYDRAGAGFSDAAISPRDSRTIARELHTLLEAASEKGPYVVVAQGAGALHARVYSDKYRNEIAALILVNPTQETPGNGAVPDDLPEQSPEVHPAMEALHTMWHGGKKESATSCREMLAMEECVREAARTNLRPEVPVVLLRSGAAGDVSRAVQDVVARLR